jgi:hypothetical protein
MVRVHELFALCPRVGFWKDNPAGMAPCLAFVTAAANVNLAARTMRNIPQKHVGILFAGEIWNYHNTQDRVGKESPSLFERRMRHAYAASKDVTLYYGMFPPGARL